MKSIVLKLAEKRRSIRAFKRTPIKIEDIIEVLEVARQAPSGANRQPWRFLIITDEKLKREIRRICEKVEKEFHEKAPEWMKKWLKKKGITWHKPFLEEAPILILVFGKTDEPHWIGSVWITIGYMLLALEEKGLATLTYTPSKTREINKLLNIPEKYILLSILPIGLPDEKPKEKKRLPLSEIAYINKWENHLQIQAKL